MTALADSREARDYERAERLLDMLTQLGYIEDRETVGRNTRGQFVKAPPSPAARYALENALVRVCQRLNDRNGVA